MADRDAAHARRRAAEDYVAKHPVRRCEWEEGPCKRGCTRDCAREIEHVP
jgi:hypothetical protein